MASVAPKPIWRSPVRAEVGVAWACRLGATPGRGLSRMAPKRTIADLRVDKEGSLECKAWQRHFVYRRIARNVLIGWGADPR